MAQKLKLQLLFFGPESDLEAIQTTLQRVRGADFDVVQVNPTSRPGKFGRGSLTIVAQYGVSIPKWVSWKNFRESNFFLFGETDPTKLDSMLQKRFIGFVDIAS